MTATDAPPFRPSDGDRSHTLSSLFPLQPLLERTLTTSATGDALDAAATERNTAGASSPARMPAGQEAHRPEGGAHRGLTVVATDTEARAGRADVARDPLRRKAVAETYRLVPAVRQTEARRAVRRQTDHANTEVLRRVLSDHGWHGLTPVGQDAARAAWLIAPHADDVGFQKIALAQPADAVTRGEAEPAHWAHLYDRCCALANLPQPYGTRYRCTSPGFGPYPIADSDSLDERRALYGLEPHARKAEALRRHHSGEAA